MLKRRANELTMLAAGASCMMHQLQWIYVKQSTGQNLAHDRVPKLYATPSFHLCTHGKPCRLRQWLLPVFAVYIRAVLGRRLAAPPKLLPGVPTNVVGSCGGSSEMLNRLLFGLGLNCLHADPPSLQFPFLGGMLLPCLMPCTPREFYSAVG